MQTRTRFVFFALALMLGTAWYTLDKQPSRGMSRLDLSQLAFGRVDKVELSRGETTTVLRKEDGRWRLSDGRRADQEAVERLLDDVRHINTSDHVSRDFNQFESFGVSGAAATYLTLVSRGKTLAHVVIGSPQKADRQAAPSYLIRRDNDVFVLNQVPAYSFLRPDEAWEDRRIVQDRAEQVVWLEAHPAVGPSFVLEGDNGRFRLQQGTAMPASCRFDPLAAELMVETLAGMTASRVHQTPPSELSTGLAQEGAAQVRWRLADGSVRSLKLGSATPEQTRFVAIEGRDEVFEVPQDRLTVLLEGLGALDARNVMAAVAPESITGLDILPPRGKKQSAQLNPDGAWHIPGQQGPKATLDAARVDQRLRQILGTQAQSVAEQSQKPSTAGRGGEIVLRTREGKRLIMALGPSVKKDPTALVDAWGTADQRRYRITVAQRDALLAGLDSLRPSAPMAQSQSLDSLPPDLQRQILQQLAQRRNQSGG